MKRIRRPSEKEQKNDSKLMKTSIKEKDRDKLPFRGPGAALLPSVALSEYDKASQLTLSEDQLTIYGCEVRIFCKDKKCRFVNQRSVQLIAFAGWL